MKLPGRNASIPITICIALLAFSAVLLASSFRAAPAKSQLEHELIALASQHTIRPLRDRSTDGPSPTLGNYPDTSLPLSTNMTVTPDAAPTNITSVTVSTATNFNGTLQGNPTTGIVRVTDANPAGTYTVTVSGFN